jgi:hypothetical protein
VRSLEMWAVILLLPRQAEKYAAASRLSGRTDNCWRMGCPTNSNPVLSRSDRHSLYK